MNHMSKMNRFRDIKLFPFTLSTGAHLPCEARHALRARLASLGFARNSFRVVNPATNSLRTQIVKSYPRYFRIYGGLFAGMF